VTVAEAVAGRRSCAGTRIDSAPPSPCGSRKLGLSHPVSELGPGHPVSELEPGHPVSELGPGHPVSELGPGHPVSELGPGHPVSELGLRHPASELGHPASEPASVKPGTRSRTSARCPLADG